MSLLALCGARDELAIRRVPLGDGARQAVDGVFASQEAAFRGGEERPFDQNWQNEDNEISTTPIPENVNVFNQIMQTPDAAIETVGDIGEIRALAMRPEMGDRLLVQVFAPGQALSRGDLLSLILMEGGTYTRLEAPVFQLGDKLVCIIEDGLIRFRSLHNLGRVIDTSRIFRAATDNDIVAFTDTHADLFEVDDVDRFVDRSSRNARKYMASLASSGVLQDHTAASLRDASEPTGLTITVRNDRIVMPSNGREITELMRFLNDGRYVGPVSHQPFITNSRRPAP